MQWNSNMAEAPRDRPILVFFDHDADPYYDGENGKLTDYAANAEGGDFLPGDGYAVAKWCDGFYESEGFEYPEYWIPGGWFVRDEFVCNPVAWCYIPDYETQNRNNPD